MRKFFWLLVLLIAGAASAPVRAGAACACCAERGAYSISVRQPDTYLLDEMKNLAFGKTATLFTTEAGLDPSVVRGLPADYNDNNTAFSDTFDFAGGFKAKQWKLDFKDYRGRAGSLLLAQPPTMLRFAVDTHDNENAGGGNVVLYKEWRFQGVAQGTGFFQAGFAPATKFFLVFQGRGNNCDSANDFTHWRVEITGRKAGYAFWGKMLQQ